MPTGVGAGKAKIFSYRVRDFPGSPLIFLKFGHRGEYGKVQYASREVVVPSEFFLNYSLFNF
jgi:hypothetical protein